jgi:NADH-quinone oxidoreductase subunit D
MYCFREREKILDLFEILCGARITLSYMRPGGIFQDTPNEFWSELETFMDNIPGQINELESLITGNEIVLSRTRNIGVLSPEDVINGSLSGPMLRASRVKWDLRKANPYEIYDELDFEIPIGATGDTFDRYLVRVKEMKESIKIINQCVKLIKPGPVRNEDVPLVIRAPENEAYAAVEGPKGELGFYLVSDGGISPYRCKIRAPSFMNLTLLKEMAIGGKIGDLIVNFGSIDIVLGEVDR